MNEYWPMPSEEMSIKNFHFRLKFQNCVQTRISSDRAAKTLFVYAAVFVNKKDNFAEKIIHLERPEKFLIAPIVV